MDSLELGVFTLFTDVSQEPGTVSGVGDSYVGVGVPGGLGCFRGR